jgi:hypothetical protein
MSENSEKKGIVNIEDFEIMRKELELLKKSKPIEKTECEEVIEKPKPKRQQTEKQKEQFQKALQARQEKIRLRAEARAKLEEEARKEAEEELIKKAIQYKKKQIKKIQIQPPSESEEEDDENEPIQKPVIPPATRGVATPAKPKLERSVNIPRNDIEPKKQPQQAPAAKEKNKFIFV